MDQDNWDFNPLAFYRSGGFYCLDSSLKGRRNYFSTDSSELFRQNLTSRPSDWPWRTQPVGYEFNSQGYRAPEFDQINWKQSLVIFGCSFPLGVGLDESQTVSCQLSQRLNRPVINMGIAGGDWMSTLMNLTTLINHWAYPRGVVLCWSDYARTIDSDKSQNLIFSGAGNPSRFYREWTRHDANLLAYAGMIRATALMICRSRSIWHYELTYFEDTAARFGIDHVGAIDRAARDGSHAGPRVQERAADMIAGAWLRANSSAD